ncbi:helix-turn-helix domain-containing protein [Streptomyces zagrosensis]|uniref:Transcriptional regulator with XRE-family HTH domain n=1 Tax=Streptomyces zagrosensis TaxID=1042984 RepID=A0A7W9QAT3_9ACTN|nr:helix-turn-helix transcriptional regulator [Streptomyces zagrosensis]MBB5936724.1 transcriptional regulator with XRE-family HTH domain [Streptomyces zagrosensis]
MSDESASSHLNPLVRFGQDVRRVREGRKITQRALGAAAGGYSESYVSKVEKGVILASAAFAEGCDRVFGTPGLYAGHRARIDEEAAPSWFVPYLKLERRATHVFDYSSTTLMGILQTDDYATAQFRAGFPGETEKVIAAKVAQRLRRRTVLERQPPLTLWVVINEAALRAEVGGPSVMAAQLDHLVDLSAVGNVELQVLPFSAGAVGTYLTAFTLLKLPEGKAVMHADDPTGGRLYQDGPAVEYTVEAFDRLRAHALAPDASRAMIRALRTGKET